MSILKGKEVALLEEKGRYLEELGISIKQCFRCSIASYRKRLVRGEGSLDSNVMLIAQAPNRQEMESGRIFTGPSGAVLDELLAAGGYTRQDCYITNLLKCPLPHCRKPRRAEIGACLPFLRSEITILRPRVLVPLGRYSIKEILREYGHSVPPRNNEIPFLFGQIFRGGGIFVIPLPHPATVLYRPAFFEPTLKLYGETLLKVTKILNSLE